MANAHLLYGFIASGKSTFAKKLELGLPAVRFSHDEWMLRLYGPNIPENLFHEYWCRTNTVMTAVWLRLLELGVDVIIDEGLWHRSRRDELRALIASVNAKSLLYFVTCSQDTMLSRLRSRNHDPKDSFLITDENFARLSKEVEALGVDETFTTVCTD